MRKIMLFLCSILVTLILGGEPVQAANVSGEWEYTVSQDEATITKYNGSASRITIPSSLGGYTVTKIGYRVFEGMYTLKEITFPNTLEEIGYCAFKGCKNITSITLPKNLSKMGYDAFYNCESLTKIIVNAVDCIYSSENTFGNAGKNTNGIEVVFSDTVKAIPRYMFDGETDEYAHIKSVEIGKNVEEIGDWAFSNCSDLTTVKLSNNVVLKIIGSYAFRNCKNLTSITFPERLEELGYEAFYNCESLEKISVNAIEISYIGTSNVFGNAGKETANGIQVIFSDSVKKIPGYMFWGESEEYARVKSVEIGKNVEEIETGAFSNCKDLSLVKISNYSSLKEIASWAFDTCSSLRGMVIPANVEYVGSYAFDECDNLKKIDVLSTKCKLESDSNTLGIPGTTVVYGYSGTTAETYANRYGYTFSAVRIPFRDISINDYYFTPVMWAVEENITSGLNASQFAPNATCTRAQVVTFLWRTMGSPLPKTTKNPFKDVSKNAYYYKAVLWAVENGITSGLNATTFGSETACSRAQVATFLWRILNKPNPTTSRAPFRDVKSNAYYYKAVLWAVENGVTAGLDATHFAPDATCTRSQIVTFLYRAFV